MKSDRLWPVLLVLAALLVGVGVLEWVAANREARFEVIEVVDSAGAVEGSGDLEAPWQASEPTSADHAHARQMLRRGEVEAALDTYASLVSDENAPVSLLTEFAYALRRADRCDDAAEVVQRALALAPNDGAVNLSNALTLRCVGDHQAADEAFQRALALRTNHAPTRLAYAELLVETGDRNRAIAVLEPASRSGTNDERARALVALGRALFERGDRAPARAALDEAVERAPSMVAIWMAVARTYLASDDPADQQRALEHALRASRLAPELAAPHSVLGRAYEKLDMRVEAIDSYRRAAQLDRGYEYVRTRLVRLGLEEEDYQVAVKAAGELMEIDPERPEYQFLHGLALSRSGDVDGARNSYMQAINLRAGDYAEAWYNLGILEREANNLLEARNAYERAVSVRPDYDTAWNNLGLVQYDLGEYAQAEASFLAAIRLRDAYEPAWTNLGRTYAAQDNYVAAAGAYERALQLDRDNRVNRLRLAAAYRRIGRVDEAIAMYRALVTDEPRYANAWYNLGIALSANGDDDGARDAYLQAIEIDPNHAASIENLGYLEARLGNNDVAMRYVTDALDRDPADIELRLKAVELAILLRDAERCRREVAAILSQDETNARAIELRARCVQ